ncbi:penicillin acylase family protein [Saliniramus fredricksonii]|uniref:Penicillin amidase n=1 Tax=Saliniramus fredricksonii TaxID=1653334 RepID=A0ABY0K9M9_9HYPH|nr:penicillin acylase family protein [Saliniramus fredricksonii]SCC81159.1 penicillin amidase [Saliniramus fredricksonii]
MPKSIPSDKTTGSEGSQSSIEVIRDVWGIPHIRAATAGDVFFANGFVHAQDRLWQMDAARRRAVGRFAEWGGPSALGLDILSRRLDIAGVSRRDMKALSPQTAMMIERYTDGVNAFMASCRGNDELPLEYRLLGENPEPWEPWHCVAVMRQRGLLMGSVWFKLWRAAALRTIGPEAVNLLRYDDGGVERFVVPQGAEGRRWIASLNDLAPAIEALAAMVSPEATLGGSNNWAIDGRHTVAGKPIIAGDPHRAFDIPGMYAQLHLTCDAFDALGFSVPGVPAFPHFAHTDRVAWCVTHAFADIHDLYVERFDGSNGERYATDAGWRETELRVETIIVRGAEAETVTVHRTRHGPIIAGDPREGFAIALRSLQIDDVDLSLDCLLPMLHARDLNAFYEATRGWGVIDHSLVGADVDGHIGVSIRAIVPRRDRLNGWLPVPGWTGEHEWRGMIPFEEMPREIDPSSGCIITANNRPVPEDWPDYIATDCHPSTRARRISELLERDERLDGSAMRQILADTHSQPAVEICSRLCQVPPRSDAIGRIQDALRGWGGAMDIGLHAPSIYYLVRQEMTRILARRSGLEGASVDALAQVPPGIPAVNHLWWTLPNLLRTEDVSLLGGAGWDDVASEAMERVGKDFPLTPWGQLHRPSFAHPLAAMFPDHAPMMAPSSSAIGGDGDCVCATGAYPGAGPSSSYGSVARYVFDLADWDSSRWIVFHGSSGDPHSPFFSDQNELWSRLEMVPALYSARAVDAHAVSRSYLEPTSPDLD